MNQTGKTPSGRFDRNRDSANRGFPGVDQRRQTEGPRFVFTHPARNHSSLEADALGQTVPIAMIKIFLYDCGICKFLIIAPIFQFSRCPAYQAIPPWRNASHASCRP
jgi:hypothetical protein